MFNYYGFTEQLFQTVYVLNTSLCRAKNICGISYKFLKVPYNRMYGIETININNTDIMVSSKERTLIDLIYFNKPVGGVSPAVNILKEIIIKKECDINKLIEYTAIFPNVTVRKRIGVVLQNIGIKTSVLRPLAKSVENTAISSLNASRRGEINKK